MQTRRQSTGLPYGFGGVGSTSGIGAEPDAARSPNGTAGRPISRDGERDRWEGSAGEARFPAVTRVGTGGSNNNTMRAGQPGTPGGRSSNGNTSGLPAAGGTTIDSWGDKQVLIIESQHQLATAFKAVMNTFNEEYEVDAVLDMKGRMSTMFDYLEVEQPGVAAAMRDVLANSLNQLTAFTEEAQTALSEGVQLLFATANELNLDR